MRLFFVCLSLIAASFAQAQQPGAPSVVNQGATNVTVNGHSVARQGDTTSNGGVIVEGSSNVMINGKPAAIAGGRTDCGGGVIGSSKGVFINGKPLVTSGDLASGCANK